MKAKQKFCIITCICLFAFTLMTVLFVIFFVHSYDINKITENRINNVTSITSENGNKIDLDTVINELYSYTYKEYSSSKGNTKKIKYYFYDSNENCLFFIENTSNRNLLLINIDGKSTLYQATKKN